MAKKEKIVKSVVKKNWGNPQIQGRKSYVSKKN